MKTIIKEAHWKSKSIFDTKGYDNIITTVYYQGDDAFIDADSKLLFEIVCENFFRQHKKAILKIKLKGHHGYMFSEAYRLYIYNLIYKKLTGKKIKNDILKVKDPNELYHRAMLDMFTEAHRKRVLKIIKILGIDFKKESDRKHRILFNKGKKKDFYLSDNILFVGKKTKSIA